MSFETSKAAIRQAFADYRRAEGCSCCRNVEKHEAAAKRLAELLDVPMYSDESGYDFGQFETPKESTHA
jgi:hypothetical protein